MTEGDGARSPEGEGEEVVTPEGEGSKGRRRRREVCKRGKISRASAVYAFRYAVKAYTELTGEEKMGKG